MNSISTASRTSGNKFLFDNDKRVITYSDGSDETVAEMRGGLYIYTGRKSKVASISQSEFNTGETNRSLLPIERKDLSYTVKKHARLEHPSHDVFNSLATKLNFDNLILLNILISNLFII